MLNRRQLMANTALAATAGAAITRLHGATDSNEQQTLARPLIVSTWPFGKESNDRALQVIQEGGSTLDAVEQGIRVIESSGNRTVGLSGHPNSAGVVQLDACIMHGPGHQAGSVAALEGIVHPISAARRVMEKTPHVMLAGDGARWFALAEGLESVDVSIHESLNESFRRRNNGAARATTRGDAAGKRGDEDTPPSADLPADNHDTITLLVLGADGTISGGCSTSGLSAKLPGRVGDSPIIGSGLYVDNEVGAAGATGAGENIMRYCASFMIVEAMRTGMDPQTACRHAIDRIARTDPRGRKLDINFVALDKNGRFGAAGTGDFPYSVTFPGSSRVLTARR
jgi:isoaspartyl peptidase/L-asparaginase-like protein (Ntn-hydrolase superfamily)